MNEHPRARMDTILRQREAPVKIYKLQAFQYRFKGQNGRVDIRDLLDGLNSDDERDHDKKDCDNTSLKDIKKRTNDGEVIFFLLTAQDLFFDDKSGKIRNKYKQLDGCVDLW